jgi:hypothetical protein
MKKMLGNENSAAKNRPDRPPSKPAEGPKKDCPYAKMVRRKLAWLNEVACALHALQDAVDKKDPGFDPTAYFTDREESRLIVVNEILGEAGLLLRDGFAEDAGDRLKFKGGAAEAMQEAFAAILDDGLDFCAAAEDE